MSGSGHGICVGLGDNTVFGRIAKQAASERLEKTTLELEILRVVLMIASTALMVTIIIISKSSFFLGVRTFDYVASFVGCVAPS